MGRGINADHDNQNISGTSVKSSRPLISLSFSISHLMAEQDLADHQKKISGAEEIPKQEMPVTILLYW